MPINNERVPLLQCNTTNRRELRHQLEQAIDSKNFGAIRSFIRQQGPHQNEYNELALEASLNKRCEKLVIDILKNKHLSPSEPSTLLPKNLEDTKIIKAILKYGTVSNSAREQALINAINSGKDIKTLRILLGEQACTNNPFLKIKRLFLNIFYRPAPLDLTRVIAAAINRANIDAIKELLAAGATISIDQPIDVIKVAIKGYAPLSLEFIKILFAYNKGILSETGYTAVLTHAATYSRLDVIETLVLNIQELFSKEVFNSSQQAAIIGNAVIAAAKHGHLNVINKLLENQPTIFPSQRGQAVIEAAKHGHLNVINKLLENNTSISDKQRGDAVIEAVKHGHLYVINKLLENGATILDDQRGDAVIEAVKHGSLDIIDKLLENGATIDDNQRGEAVIQAVIRRDLGIVNILLENGATIPPIKRGEAVIQAVKHNNLIIVNKLLENDAIILNDQRGDAIIQAVIKGRLSIITKLLENGATIPPSKRGEAVIQAVIRRDLNIINKLLENGATILDDQRGDAVIEAVKHGSLDIIHKLLENGATIDDNQRGEAVIQAVIRRDLGIVNILLENGATIPNIKRAEAFIEATKHGHLEMMRLLSNTCSFTPDQIDQIIRIVTYNQNNPPLIAFLLELSPDEFGSLQKIYVKASDLKANPEKYLAFVAKHGFVSGVRFLNEDGTEQNGIDAGGLTKAFINQLIDQLKAKPVIMFDETLIPTWSSDSQEVDYKNFGLFLTAIESKNVGKKDKIFTGEFCNKKTFGLLKTMLDPTLTEDEKLEIVAEACKTNTNKTLIDFALNKTPDEAQITAIQDELKRVYYTDYTDSSVEDLKQVCLESIKDNQYKALKTIASGIKDPLKSQLLTLGEACSDRIQGCAHPTYEQICAKLSVETAYLTSDQRSQLTQKVEWIKQKIEHELTVPTSTWIKDFFRCVTSQPVLPAVPIVIRGTQAQVCKAHTCHNILDVPFSNQTPHIEDPSDEQRFLKLLQLTIDSQTFDLS